MDAIPLVIAQCNHEVPMLLTDNERIFLEEIRKAGVAVRIRDLDSIPTPSKGGVVRSLLEKSAVYCFGPAHKRMIEATHSEG